MEACRGVMVGWVGIVFGRAPHNEGLVPTAGHGVLPVGGNGHGVDLRGEVACGLWGWGKRMGE